MSKANGVQLRIVAELQRANKPLLLGHIAKRTDISRSLVQYHVQKMLRDGLLLTTEYDGKTWYLLQPVFYDENWLNALYNQLTPFIEEMAAGDKVSFEQADVTNDLVVVNVLGVFLQRFQQEVRKQFK